MPPKNLVKPKGTEKEKEKSFMKTETVKDKKAEKKDSDTNGTKNGEKGKDNKMANDEKKGKDVKDTKDTKDTMVVKDVEDTKDTKAKNATKGQEKGDSKDAEKSKEKKETSPAKAEEGKKSSPEASTSADTTRPTWFPKPLHKMDNWVEKTFRLKKFRSRLILYSVSIASLVLLIIIIGVAAGVASAGAAGCPAKYKKLSATHSYCKATSPLMTKSGVSDADKDVIVKLHNLKRSTPLPGTTLKGMNMQKVYWDDEIAKIADKYARFCPSDHDTYDERAVPGETYRVGQNLAWGQTTWTEAVDDWFNEYKQFVYGDDTVSIDKVGHYIMMMQESGAKIGCGYAECDDQTTFVCNYGYFNYNRKTPFHTGPACANCSTSCETATGLCDCKALMCATAKNVDCQCH